jgi:small subunit ribosomal protein S2
MATSVTMPDIKDLLKSGVQFGHETKRWNPKMSKFILGEKNGIHIIDVEKTLEGLQSACTFLTDAASRGSILIVGTKKQASELVKAESIRSGAYFIETRWAGGLLTNFKMVKESLAKLNSLEQMFEEGVAGRTKYEISRMKKEWQKLDRLYSGIKSLTTKPSAVVILDTNFEKAAIKECRRISIPVVALVDSNSNPEMADYPIPANDDAINSIKLILKVIGDAILEGNKGSGVKHVLKDYSKVDVKITKSSEEAPVVSEVGVTDVGAADTPVNKKNKASSSRPTTKKIQTKGILERVKDDADKSKKSSKA